MASLGAFFSSSALLRGHNHTSTILGKFTLHEFLKVSSPIQTF